MNNYIESCEKRTGRSIAARSRLRTSALLVGGGLVLLSSGRGFLSAATAQDAGGNHAQPGAPPGPAAEKLPVRDVVLFSSGVGYFQRTGTVEGAATVPLIFRTGHVDDVLKSLILIDPQGHVEPVTYTSQEPVEQALKSFGIDVSQNISLVDLLRQLRGVPVEVIQFGGTGAITVRGTVLSVETHNQEIKHPDGTVTTLEVSSLNLLTDTGIRSIPLTEINQFSILDTTLAGQLKEALKVLAAGRDAQQKVVTLHFGDGPARQVQVGYVTESPIWKTSYRLSLQDAQKPYMQGWAVVDNSTDQDWENVNLSLVSGQPISFIEDLYTPLFIPRPVVPPDVQANPYPQLSEENVMQNARQALAGGGAGGGTTGAGVAAPAAPPPMPSGAAAPRHAARKTPEGRELADEAASTAPETPPTDLSHSGVNTAATGQKAGELFQYRIGVPVSVPRQQSAMIPIVTEAVQAEKLDVYNAEVDADHPENGLELTNTTGLHLKAGPVTILDGSSYAGDARLPELEPGEKQLITYAVDTGITGVKQDATDADGDNVERTASLSIKHGVIVVTSRQQATIHYTLKSKLDKDKMVLVETPIQQGWNLREPAKADEKTRSLYRFRVAVPAGKTVPLKVVQATLDSEEVGLIDADINTIQQYQQNAAASPALKAALEKIAAQKSNIAKLQAQLDGEKARIDLITQEQDRIRKNMTQLDQSSALYKRYTAELDTQETSLQKLRDHIDHLQVEITAAKTQLTTTIDGLNVT